MADIPENLKYTKDHEWVAIDSQTGIMTLGITDFAQESLGDITYVEMPDVGVQFDAGDTLGAVESVKAASDIYCPLAGEVVERNDALDETPEAINDSPYEAGWLVKVKLDDASAADELLDPSSYASVCE
ncbi:MAG: glycine cleavage system protein GcvH [Opitutales bacterium]|nr:glycine cleavage system protein GcvH [Opitutales bacterium]NRA27223.1 glycine cleavage system protein GcvH [Opitutales bacterium]